MEQGELVFFDDKVVVGLSFLDQIASQSPLGQQGISGNLPVLDIDGRKQGDGRLDLIGSLDFFCIG